MPRLSLLFDDKRGKLVEEPLAEALITEDSKGRYLLCRDLHTVSFWQLKEWINDELPLSQEDVTTHLPWQARAYQLLRDQRHQQRDLLDITLDELYKQT